MALTGADKALMYALAGIARAGATRAGYTGGGVFLAIDGIHYGFAASGEPGVVMGSLSITDMLDEAPNQCRFTVNGAIPPAGELVVTLGSINNLERLFAGFVTTIGQRYAADQPRYLQAECSAVDYHWLFSFVKVTARYGNLSATTIASDLVTRYGAVNGFTARGVAPGLPAVDEITFTNEDLGDCLMRLARRIGGYFYVDYHKDVHLFFEETRNGDPVPLTLDHKSLADFRPTNERTQALTRVYVEGRGARVLSHVAVGDTMIPVETVDAFTPAADVFLKVSRQGAEGGASHLDFTGVVSSTGGSLVGPGMGPPGSPALVAALGTGLSAGTYQYAYTDITASGETLPGPIASMTLGGQIAPPTPPPVITVNVYASGVDSGLHEWTYTFQSAGGGETTGAARASATTNLPMANPNSAPQTCYISGNGPLAPYHSWFYVFTYTGTDSGETQAYTYGIRGFNNLTVGVGMGPNCDGITFPPGVSNIRFYRSTAQPSHVSQWTGPYYFVAETPLNQPFISDQLPDATLVTRWQPPAANYARAKAGYVYVEGIPPGPAGTTARKVYRTRLSDGSMRYVATINDNTSTQMVDDVPDSSLGAVIPTSNTAGDEYRQVSISNIAAGPAGTPATTARKVYRSTAGGAQLKLLATLADNTTTTYLDSVGDGALGANAPTSDTSGMLQPAGQVPAGSPTILVANAGMFRDGGGWAVIGNGEQVIRYTAKTAGALTGVPATGIGAIVAAVAFNSTITAAPMLTGIPVSGARAITAALVVGDELYTVVQVDDASAQAALADAVGGPGIREEWVQDRRLSITEGRARGQATLATRPVVFTGLSYRCRDLRTASGKTITVNMPAAVTGTYKIQQVTISDFRPHRTQYPTYTVEASSTRFTFEDFLRRMKTKE